MSRVNEMDVEIIESDIELDTSDVVEPDSDPPEEMGDPAVEVNEEYRGNAEVLKTKALEAICEDELLSISRLIDAKDYLTGAILLIPKSSLLLASRASVFVKLKKPNAAIRDADAALKINFSLAKGYKARGMANAMLGLWEQANKDLSMASKLDFDEETFMMLKKASLNAKKVKEHREKYENLRKEKELRRAELERQRDAEAASVLRDGEVLQIRSSDELKIKLNAASRLSRLAVVYFYAEWAGPCRYILPAYAHFARVYPEIVFLMIDSDEAVDVACEWGVDCIPLFFFMKNGEMVDKAAIVDERELKEKICRSAALCS